jgi:hypothetical protein
MTMEKNVRKTKIPFEKPRPRNLPDIYINKEEGKKN